MRVPGRGLLHALAFLSRVWPGGGYVQDLPAAVPWYPAAGAILGLLAALPCLVVRENSLIAAWLYVILMAWLSRGLHWDGLADLADACGSHADGDRFWAIIKDSRTGAFGVLALVCGVGLQVAAVRQCLTSGNLLPLILAPAFGRSLVIIFGRLTTPHPRSALAELVHPGMTSRSAIIACGLAIAVCLGEAATTSLPAPLSIVPLSILLLAWTVRLARRQGGCNGDFYGTVIQCGEILFTVSWAVA